MANGIGPIANLLGKVDANGALLVAISGGSVGPVDAISFTGGSSINGATANTLKLRATGSTDILTLSSTSVASSVPIDATGNSIFRSATDTLLTVTSSNAGGDVYLAFTNTGDNTNPWTIGRDDTGLFRWVRDGSTKMTWSTSDVWAFDDAVVFGWSDVSLSRGAANRLDLASGDSFSLVSGGLGVGTVETTSGRITATGNIGGAKFVAVGGNAQWTSGTGSPEGVVTAEPGSMFSRINGGAGTSFYVKESGSGNTGWVAK